MNDWNYPGYIVYQQLIDTRPWWTPSLVRQFLPVADLYVTNPHNTSQQMRLYLLERVVEREHSRKFKKFILNIHSEKIDPRKYIEFSIDLRKERNRINKNRRLNLRKKIARIESCH